VHRICVTKSVSTLASGKTYFNNKICNNIKKASNKSSDALRPFLLFHRKDCTTAAKEEVLIGVKMFNWV
jgi:hypothetical protein